MQYLWNILKIKNTINRTNKIKYIQYIFKKKLNYKIIISPENDQPHPFHPTQFPFPYHINNLIINITNIKTFNINILNK